MTVPERPTRMRRYEVGEDEVRGKGDSAYTDESSRRDDRGGGRRWNGGEGRDENVEEARPFNAA